MNRIARDIISVAVDLMPRINASYARTADVEERTLNAIHFDIQRFISTLRKNESIESFVMRRDNDKVMEITVGFENHEAMKGIVDSMESMFKKLARKNDVEVEVSIPAKTKEKS